MALSPAATALWQRFVADPDLAGLEPSTADAAAADELCRAGLLCWELRLTSKGTLAMRRIRAEAEQARGEQIRQEELAKAEADVERLRRAVR